MGLHMRGFVVFVHFFLLMLSPSSVFAADFGAEIADVDGRVEVIQKATGKNIAAIRGLRLAPGDVVETAAEAETEILYDDGNVTRLDQNTRLEITKLSIEADKTRESVLNLVSGRIKNSVSKLVTKKSKFEVNSKTVTAGVTGTPPWVVSVVGGKTPAEPVKTEIDLLKGEKGGVFVRGTDPKASTIILTPGTRTVAQMGMPPMNPFSISVARLNELQRIMPITTLPAVRQEKRKQLDAMPAEVSKKKEEGKKDEKKEEAKKEDNAQGDNAAKDEGKAESAASSSNQGDGGAPEQPPVGAAATAVDSAAGAPSAGTNGASPATAAPQDAGVAGKAGGAGLVMDYMTHVVSVAPVAVPTAESPSGKDPTGVSTETQVSQGANALSGASTSAVAGTTRVRVRVGIAYK